MLRSSLILYQKLIKDMEAIGFKVNPYDNCMANKMVRDKQMTINWHVDGLKVYHADKDIVDAFIQRTKETY